MKPIMQKKEALEQEFEEPLRDILLGFVEMGHSMSLVAEALGVTLPSLKKFCSVEKIRFSRRPIHKRQRGRFGLSNPAARPINFQGQTMSLRECADQLGLSSAALGQRLQRDASTAFRPPQSISSRNAMNARAL